MPKYRLADAYPPYVLQRYPELAIGMKCKTCSLDVLVGFSCHCSRGPTPDIGGVEFALDGLRTNVLVALKKGCKDPESSECFVTAPCSYDAFLRLFCLMPDMVNNAASESSPPPGLTYKPAAAQKVGDPWKREQQWTEREYMIVINDENAALRLLDLKRTNAAQLNVQAWKSLYVHPNNGTACGAVVPLQFAHHTNRKTGAGDFLSVTFSTFKVDGAQGSRMPSAMASDLHKNVVKCNWLTSFWKECTVTGMGLAMRKNNARKKMKTSNGGCGGGGGECVGRESVEGDGSNAALGLPSLADEDY